MISISELPFIRIENMRIRQVSSSDLLALEWGGQFTHYRLLFRDAFYESQIGNAVLWVAEFPLLGLVGQAFVQLLSNDPQIADGMNQAYIHSVRVRNDLRNRGIGSRLMNSAEQDLIHRGFSYVILNVSQDNLDARRLYERLGYVVVAPDPGRWSYFDHKGHKHDVNEPAWRMKKKLSP